jgi:hypothetical protein
MSERKGEMPFIERLSLAEARKRIHEFKHVKMIEGKSGGAAVPAGQPGRPASGEKGPTTKGKTNVLRKHQRRLHGGPKQHLDAEECIHAERSLCDCAEHASG